MGSGSSKNVSVPPIHGQEDTLLEKSDNESKDVCTNTTESFEHTSATKTDINTSRDVRGLSVTGASKVDNRDEVVDAMSAAGSADVSCIDDDAETVAEAEVSYAEFPTHVNLREANEKYAKKRGGSIPRDSDGSLKPFPSYRRKAELFDAEQFRELDEYADQVNTFVLVQAKNLKVFLRSKN